MKQRKTSMESVTPLLTFFNLCNLFADIFALASSIRTFSAALSLRSLNAVLFLPSQRYQLIPR